MKEKLKLILIILEFLIGCVFLAFYLLLPVESPYKSMFFAPTIIMFCLTLITIHHFGMEDKVKKVVKKIASVVFSVTIGLIFKMFDALLNMTTTGKNSDLKVITGYEDNVFSLQKKKKKRKANYKSYRLMDNREKVRFLYYKTVTKAVRKGYAFREADTPFEVNLRLIKRKYLKNQNMQLSGIYNVSRYDSEGIISDEMVEIMKNEK